MARSVENGCARRLLQNDTDRPNTVFSRIRQYLAGEDDDSGGERQGAGAMHRAGAFGVHRQVDAAYQAQRRPKRVAEMRMTPSSPPLR